MAHCRHKEENFGFSITIIADIYGGFYYCARNYSKYFTYLTTYLILSETP